MGQSQTVPLLGEGKPTHGLDTESAMSGLTLHPDHISTFLEQSFQNLLYGILIAMIRVPKTLLLTVVRPRCVLRYLAAQLRDCPPHKPFEELSHPITFFVLTSVLPVIGIFPVLIAFAQMITGKTLPIATDITITSEVGVRVPSDFATTLKPLFDALLSLSLGIKFLVFFALLLSWPLSTALVIQGFRPRTRDRVSKGVQERETGLATEGGFTELGFRFVIYSQLYLYSPLYLWHFLAFFVACIYPQTLYSPKLLILVFALPEYYFASRQWRIIRDQTGAGGIMAVGILILTFLAGLVAVIFCEVIAFLPIILWHLFVG